jgi:hypothetical protein
MGRSNWLLKERCPEVDGDFWRAARKCPPRFPEGGRAVPLRRRKRHRQTLCVRVHTHWGMTLVSLRVASFMPFGPRRYKPLIPRYLDAAD